MSRALQARLEAQCEYKYQLHGQRLLPPEVLSNIFLMCQPYETDMSSSYELDRSIPYVESGDTFLSRLPLYGHTSRLSATSTNPGFTRCSEQLWSVRSLSVLA